LKASTKIQVTKLIFAIVAMNLFALPFAWDYAHIRIWAPLLFGAAIAIIGVASGWRQGGLAKSLFFGMVYACTGFLPSYFFGWLSSGGWRGW
jgi:hypothetical protein